MHKQHALIIFIVLIINSTFSLIAQDNTIAPYVPTITFASDATWPPMEYLDKNNNIIGFEIDLINAIAKEANFKVKILSTPWDGIFDGLLHNEYDAILSSVTITEERKKLMDFSIAYINAGQVFIIKKENNLLFKQDNISNKTIGGQIGTTGLMKLKDTNAFIKPYDEIVFAFDDLKDNKIDAVICDLPIAAAFSKLNRNYANLFSIILPTYTDEYFGIAVNKSRKSYLVMINTGLEKIIENKIIDTIYAKWFR